MAKTNSGWSSISAVMLDAVRATLRTVSRSGHSQAESMCAWPTALMRCAVAPAGAASAVAVRARAAAAVPATSSGHTASSARSTPAAAPSAAAVDRQLGHQLPAPRDPGPAPRPRCRTPPGRRGGAGRAARRRRSACRRAWWRHDVRVGRGLDVQLDPLAAGGRSVMGSQAFAGLRPLSAAVGAVDQALRGEPGRSRRSRGRRRPRRSPGPLGRHRAGDLEPAGAPGRTPRLADLDGRFGAASASAAKGTGSRARATPRSDRGAVSP